MAFLGLYSRQIHPLDQLLKKLDFLPEIPEKKRVKNTDWSAHAKPNNGQSGNHLNDTDMAKLLPAEIKA